MPFFSPISSATLAMAHRDLQVIFNEVIKYYDCTIAKSYETKAESEDYFNRGLSKIHYPTKHNSKPSQAVDVYPYIKGHCSFDLRQGLVFGGYVMGFADILFTQGKITHKIRWGADWNQDRDVTDNPFEDVGHFEIVPNPGEVFQYYET